MKLSFRIFLAIVVFGLFNQTSLGQTIAETDTIQFHFPLEVGNVWVYRGTHIYNGFECYDGGLHCVRERIEITDLSTVDGDNCASVTETETIIQIGYVRVRSYRLCRSETQLYLRINETTETESKDVLIDFSMSSNPWIQRMNGNLFDLARIDSIDGDSILVIHRYTSIDSLSMVSDFPDGYYEIWTYESNVGVQSKTSFYDSQGRVLRGSYLNGVLSGDTTYVYTTSIDDVRHPEQSEGPVLLGNYPNPFNPSTVVGYRLTVFGEVRISVVNQLGQHVATLFDGNQAPGQHSVTFDAAGLPSGMYVVVLETAGFRGARKITLLK